MAKLSRHLLEKMTSRGQAVSVETCYGALAFFLTVIHNIFLLYHVDIFVSVYKIDKSSFWIGETVFLLWNSFNDPLFGWLSDRKYLSSTKSSNQNLPDIVMRRISALQWCGPLFAVSFLAFWIQWTYPALQFVICLCVYDGFLTMIDLHHSALLADLAISAESRTRLNSRCSLFSAMGSISVFLSYAVWNKQHLRSLRIFCMSLSLLSVLGFLIGSNILRNAVLKRQTASDVIVTQRYVWIFENKICMSHNFHDKLFNLYDIKFYEFSILQNAHTHGVKWIRLNHVLYC